MLKKQEGEKERKGKRKEMKKKGKEIAMLTIYKSQWRSQGGPKQKLTICRLRLVLSIQRQQQKTRALRAHLSQNGIFLGVEICSKNKCTSIMALFNVKTKKFRALPAHVLQ